MTTTQPMPATPQSAAACVICGSHTLTPKSDQLTRKRRVKFGGIWLLVCILSVGFGLIAYLVWPRTTEVVGVDRYLECSTCGARQP